MKSRILYALPALILGAIASFYVLMPQSAELSSAQASVYSVKGDTAKKGRAQIRIQEDTYDFKNIEQGTFAEHNFVIDNTGKDTLVILSTHPSCGCTAAIMEGSQSIPPGGSSRLHVKFDANNKGEGPIIKTVTISSNSAMEPEKIVRIQGTIVKSKVAHKMTMHMDGIFTGDCAKCHVDKGKGELGARLFEADCALCHGLKADGKPGPELASEAMLKHTPKQWKSIIADGVTGKNMPAFHTKNKGPLGDEEIASLLEYMTAFKKEAERNKTLKSISPNTGSAVNSAVKTSGAQTGHATMAPNK